MNPGESCANPFALTFPAGSSQQVTFDLSTYVHDDQPVCNTLSTTGRDAVLELTLATARDVTITATAPMGFEPIFSVREAGCSAGTTLVCNDTFDTGLNSLTLYNLAAGSYFIWVAGFDASSSGNTTVTVATAQPAPTPTNDTCASPITLFADGGTSELVTAHLGSAANNTQGTCGGDGNDVVYQVSLATPRILTVNVSPDDTIGDPVVYLRSSACSSANPSDQVLCQDNGGSGDDEAFTTGLLPAGDYFLFVDAYTRLTSGPVTVTATLTGGTGGGAGGGGGSGGGVGGSGGSGGSGGGSAGGSGGGSAGGSGGGSGGGTSSATGVASLPVTGLPTGFNGGWGIALSGGNVYFSVSNSSSTTAAGSQRGGIGHVPLSGGAYTSDYDTNQSTNPLDPQAIFFSGTDLVAFNGLFGSPSGTAGLYRVTGTTSATALSTNGTPYGSGAKYSWAKNGSNFYMVQYLPAPYDVLGANATVTSPVAMTNVTNDGSYSGPFGVAASSTKLYVFDGSSTGPGTILTYNLNGATPPAVPQVTGAPTTFSGGVGSACDWNARRTVVTLDDEINPTRLFFTAWDGTAAGSAGFAVNRICVINLDASGLPTGTAAVYAGPLTGAAPAGSVDGPTRVAARFEQITALTFEGATGRLFVLQRVNSANPGHLVRIVNPAADPLTIITTTLPNVVTGRSYAAVVERVGGPTSVTWSIASGTNSSWLSIDPSTGALSGTAPAAGTMVSVTIRVEETGNPSNFTEAMFTFSVTASPEVDSIPVTGLPTGFVPGWGLAKQGSSLYFSITNSSGATLAGSQRGGIGFVPDTGGAYTSAFDSNQSTQPLDPQVIFFSGTNLNAFNGIFGTVVGTAGLYRVTGTTTSLALSTNMTPYSSGAKYGWHSNADNFFLAQFTGSPYEILGANASVSAPVAMTQATMNSSFAGPYGVAASATQLYVFGSATVLSVFTLNGAASPMVPTQTSTTPTATFTAPTGPCAWGANRLLAALDSETAPTRLFYTRWGATSGSTADPSGRICVLNLDAMGVPTSASIYAGPTTATLGSADGTKTAATFQAVTALHYDTATGKLYVLQRSNSVSPSNLIRVINP